MSAGLHGIVRLPTGEAAGMQKVLAELKRRNVFRVAAIYVPAAWLLAQFIGLLAEWYDWSPPAVRSFFFLLALGFVLALVGAWLFELTPEGVKRTRDVAPEDSIRSVTARKLDRLLIGVLGLLVAVLVVDRVFFMSPAAAPVTAEATSGAASAAAVPAGLETAAPSRNTVAVLPFANFSSDPEQAFFADGISEEILNSLAQISGLQVTARTSSFYFKGRNEDLRTIGDTLGVAHVLEGSVRKAGADVRVTAQLVDVSTGYHLWSQTYDRKFEDIFAIQEDIATSVARALEITLGVGEIGRSSGMTRNTDAYEAYLAGGVAYQRLTPEGVREAEVALKRAVAIDPTFALAWGRLISVYRFAPTVLPNETARWRAEEATAIAEASRLAPDSFPIRLLIAATSTADIAQALRRFEALDRSEAVTREDLTNYDFGLGRAMLATGRLREAIAALERAKAASPLEGAISWFLSEALAAAGDLPGAIAEQDRGMTLGGPQALLRPGALLTALAARDRALIERRIELARDTSFGLDLNAAMAPLLDKPAEALAELRRINVDPPNAVRGGIVAWAAYFGDNDFALDVLGSEPMRTDQNVVYFSLWRPVMRDARRLPAFKQLVRQLGLVDLWRQTRWPDLCRPIGADDFECE